MTESAAVTRPSGAAPHRPATRAWWRPAAEAPNRQDVDPAGERFDRPLFDVFADVAQRQPNACAVRAGSDSIGYGTLHAAALALAARIDAATQPGVAVATLLAEPVDSVCAMLACLAAARPCITLNTNNPPERLADILADARVGGVVLPARGDPCALPDGVATIRLGTVRTPTPWRARPASPDAPAVVVYTSGSTGRPKGIVRSQRQVFVRSWHRIAQFGLVAGDGALLMYPISSGPGVTACFASLLSGGVLHVADVSAIGPRGVLDLARATGVVAISCLPALLRVLFALDGADAAFASLRFVYSTSESVLRQDVERWRTVLPDGCRIRTGYGLTEGSPLADWFISTDLAGDGARLPIGYPIPWFEFAITDPTGAPVADGAAGELWARGRLLSLGEWRDGRCVPGRLIADPDDALGAILRTGDLVRRRPDGLMDFLGRIDEQIRIRGNRVEPAEAERVLRATPGVGEAAILVRRTTGDPVLVGFISPAVTGAQPPVLRQAAMHRLSASLPVYMRPRRLHVVASLPRLPAGKVDPDALERLDDAALAGPAA